MELNQRIDVRVVIDIFSGLYKTRKFRLMECFYLLIHLIINILAVVINIYLGNCFYSI